MFVVAWGVRRPNESDAQILYTHLAHQSTERMLCCVVALSTAATAARRHQCVSDIFTLSLRAFHFFCYVAVVVVATHSSVLIHSLKTHARTASNRLPGN